MENLEQWRKAGRIAAQALEFGKGLIKPGASIREVCDAVDKKIVELGAQPAWPTQVGLNHVAAHWTSDPEDNSLFKDELICLDVGAHVDGFVGDNACSVDLSGKYAHISKAAKEALDAAIKKVGIGVEVGEIGKVIEEVITSHNLKPVRNLSGHGISQWTIHDAPSIPNFGNGNKTKLEKGQVIAIEPFVTNGAGMIHETDQANIFALVDNKPVRSPFAREVLQFVENNYGPLPFTTRWLTKQFGAGKVSLGLKELLKSGILHQHPPLVEQAKGMVAVWEKTLLVDDKVEILTKVD